MFSPIPYCTLGKRDIGTLGDLPRDIQLAGNRGGMWTQAVWLQDLSLSSSALPWPIEGSSHRTTSHHCLTPWPRILYCGGITPLLERLQGCVGGICWPSQSLEHAAGLLWAAPWCAKPKLFFPKRHSISCWESELVDWNPNKSHHLAIQY